MLAVSRSIISILGGAVFLIALTSTAFAQTGTSSVRGTVRDAQGAIVAGATITLQSETKNFRRTQVSNQNGNYAFTAVPPDTYKIEVEATGFKKTSMPGVQAMVDTSKVVDVLL